MRRPKRVVRTAPRVRAADIEYTEEERGLILTYFKELFRVPELRDLLRERESPVSGTKPVLVDRITQAVEDGTMSYVELVELLDGRAPWGAQHVYLLGEPNLNLKLFRTAAAFETHLKAHKAAKHYNKRLPLILPETLTLSAIEHTGARIRVTAVERREGWHRDADLDKTDRTEDGEPIHFRAYIRSVSRGLVAFEWNLIENHAMVQVSQLPSGWDYDEARDRLASLMVNWLNTSSFGPVNLRRAVSAFHQEEEEDPDGSRVRSHGIEYETQYGRRLRGRSPTSADSVLGESAIDDALQNVRKVGVGRSGNFYWKLETAGHEVHLNIRGEAGRINFPTANTEEALRHVLDGIRQACK